MDDWYETSKFLELEISKGVTPLEISLAIVNERYASGSLSFLPKTEYMVDQVRERIREKRARIAKWILAALLAPAAFSVNEIVAKLNSTLGENNWDKVVEVGKRSVDDGSPGKALDAVEAEITDTMIEPNVPSHDPDTKKSEEGETTGSIDMGRIVTIESSGNPLAENSRSGARGLTQVMPKTWAETTEDMGVDWPWDTAFDPKRNLAVGRHYLNVIIPRYLRAMGLPDTVDIRLAAYNWGVGRVKRVYDPDSPDAWKKFLPDETRKYIRKYHQ